MKCPICNSWTSVLETRQNDEFNTIWRRKQCANLHSFTTIEAPTAKRTPRPDAVKKASRDRLKTWQQRQPAKR